jgi:hypothetical protein
VFTTGFALLSIWWVVLAIRVAGAVRWAG